MSSRFRNIVGIFLLAVYAFFFASTNLFYHTHQFENVKIVHSHAGDKNQNHTASQLVLIETLSNDSYDSCADVVVPESFDVYAAAIVYACCEFILPVTQFDSISLRAPPAWIS